MNKCDWCRHSDPDKNGKLKCRFLICKLTQKEILEILKNMPKGAMKND